jgi:hypothetical protein
MTRERLLAAINEEKAQVTRDESMAFRLTADELRRLHRVAKAQGLKAATLARILVMTGVDDLEAKGKG